MYSKIIVVYWIYIKIRQIATEIIELFAKHSTCAFIKVLPLSFRAALSANSKSVVVGAYMHDCDTFGRLWPFVYVPS